ncbi:hypothetical protein HPB50_009768 [Hyalomma asiaticum]|uniref:Uncharacterized protein n=1 Tax=Hyalomma asiaticum TaxID=266040 RepID=A0ACB7S538_HYAAI|nr:hypothetical protein HPB50_009768 [Hyalomma asiaticum]
MRFGLRRLVEPCYFKASWGSPTQVPADVCLVLRSHRAADVVGKLPGLLARALASRCREFAAVEAGEKDGIRSVREARLRRVAAAVVTNLAARRRSRRRACRRISRPVTRTRSLAPCRVSRQNARLS